MFNDESSTDPVYVPILKGKQGELDALRLTHPEVAASITPVIEIPPSRLSGWRGRRTLS